MAPKINASPQTSVIQTLDSEVKDFANTLPYWSKFLANKIFAGAQISDEDIDTSYSYLLEELNLLAPTSKPEINIIQISNAQTNFKSDLIFSQLSNVEGVNALSENQILEFCPTLTIVYGTNGSGKSGYVRLLKKSFYSKSPEEIIPNVHLSEGHKSVSATFRFQSANESSAFTYPLDHPRPEFEQYAVFDGKSVITHLDQKNPFEFRPAGLSFFGLFTDATKRVEAKLNAEVQSKRAGHTLPDLVSFFEGESEIKTFVQGLNFKTKKQELEKWKNFTEQDQLEKTKVEKAYDDLNISLKNAEKEIQSLENIKKLLSENEKSILSNNAYFSKDQLEKLANAIEDCKIKEKIVQSEGLENFKTENINAVGSKEWKDFIESAEKFSSKQKQLPGIYPDVNDKCLLCQQPLSDEARKLIESYWKYIKSIAEENAKQAQEKIQKGKASFEKIIFNLFPEENVLSLWLADKHPELLSSLKMQLEAQASLCRDVIQDLAIKNSTPRSELKIDTSQHAYILEAIDTSIKTLKDGQQNTELERLIKEKAFYTHKQKFHMHYDKIEAYFNNQIWIKKSESANFNKHKITNSEKTLSDKYFNQKFVDAFNEECKLLSGNFGIEISHTGSGGKSYRQLKLKGRNPHSILSEGEQKVIAIADFLVEMGLSDINRGIIFDDPVTSLDEKRKSQIALRLIKESMSKQVIVFTHDLVFVSSLISHSKDLDISHDCHWIESLEGAKPGTIWLKNTPSFEKDYKTSGKARSYYESALKLAPEAREDKVKNGFASLRTSYETLVVFGLFKGVVQRFEERVSVDSLKSVFFDVAIRDELLDSFHHCCRYMEGHSHSDKYAYQKPTLQDLDAEIRRFDAIKKKISDQKNAS